MCETHTYSDHAKPKSLSHYFLVLFMEDSTDRLMAILRLYLTTRPIHVEPVSAIQELLHSICNLVDISYIDQNTLLFTHQGSNSSDPCRQHGTCAGQRLY